MSSAEAMKPFTLFYDGACPLCQAEITFLQARNQAGLLRFVDIHSEQYSPEQVGVSCEAALATMYGQEEGQQPISGVAVFGEAYRRAKLPILAWIFTRSWLIPVLGPSYSFFAKHRHAISNRLGPPLLRLAKSRYPDAHKDTPN